MDTTYSCYGSVYDQEIDLYEVLSISKTASKAEIKKAYHKAALASHPDKVPEEERGAAEIKFKAVSQAYDILGDDDKRAMYDQPSSKCNPRISWYDPLFSSVMSMTFPWSPGKKHSAICFSAS